MADATEANSSSSAGRLCWQF